MKVTLLAVVDPAQPSSSFLKPKKGNHYVAVELRLTNVGEANYNDSPSNGAVLIDKSDFQYESSLGEVEPDLGSPIIAPGDSRVGFITFEVPDGTKLRLFQFTLESGFGPQTAQWVLS
jgi:hypothetical protein